jgi:hypothetical protein
MSRLIHSQLLLKDLTCQHCSLGTKFQQIIFGGHIQTIPVRGIVDTMKRSNIHLMEITEGKEGRGGGERETERERDRERQRQRERERENKILSEESRMAEQFSKPVSI